MNVSINKQGVLSGTPIEPFLQLPDGSCWRLILFHYIDHGNNLFTQTNASYCNDWGLFSRLQYANTLKYGDKWEFYSIEDGTTYRWTQTTTPAATAGVTVGSVSGYNTPRVGLVRNDSDHYSYYGTNLLGQAGCWTSMFYGNDANEHHGCMGFGNFCEYYLALYARVDTISAFLEPDAVNANSFQEY